MNNLCLEKVIYNSNSEKKRVSSLRENVIYKKTDLNL